ncbi:sulfurtransferase/chromate resistance protein [Pseudorhodobacter sp. MZDSW-24AT]|uniref:chromate resistance protein ChrB domain-containing protein n=1 Tax=Pseudorhodobacter sp. MZDSW-24AT TaxID=2052957 RepID=UPI000C1F29FF|nr:sulfurtransferase/chromate resistance protein [Pseudorhodobacter sp. MZDSW-24AT]PJF10249.1 sulfurtransferase [Pseudorhodobacter sp. MZDSW-24AT]
MPAPDAMSCEQLARLVGTPKAPTILDVRREAVRAGDPRLLPGARALAEVDLSLEGLARIAAGFQGPVVVVCAEGHRLSQGTAAWLRHEGVHAEYLMGGQAAWTAANLPLIDPGKITARDAQERSIWVTRSRPKIDRIACPWLIRRFIDPHAVFLFVAPAEVQGVAERFGAMPYDIEGVFWSHRDDLCTFDVLLAEFGLSTPALDRLALIVRGADTSRPDLAPECAGLLAASLGLSRMYSDDLEQLEAGIALYDAFYRWARDATEEQHNWPTNTGKQK